MEEKQRGREEERKRRWGKDEKREQKKGRESTRRVEEKRRDRLFENKDKIQIQIEEAMMNQLMMSVVVPHSG